MDKLKETIRKLGGLKEPVDFTKLTGRVGGVYPFKKDSYYVYPDLGYSIVEVECKKGFFFAEVKEG